MVTKKITYYISAQGNDLHDGMTASTAWQTIDKINNTKLNPGDRVLFNRGDIFRGELQINYSGTDEHPIIFSSYGKGHKPILSGALKVRDWKDYEGAIQQSHVPTKVLSFYLNNCRQILARYPKTGFFTIESGSKLNLTDNRNLNTSFNLCEAGVKIRSVNWQYENMIVASHKGGTITFENKMIYNCAKGSGYFLDNKKEFLTNDGEWYYDQQDNFLFYIPKAGTQHHRLTSEAGVYQYGIIVGNDVSNITISDIRFEKYETAGIYCQPGASKIQISKCQICNITTYGVMLDASSNNNSIIGCKINDILGRGISTIESSNNIISLNNISRVGLVPGYGFPGVNNGIGIAILKSEVTFSITRSTLEKLKALPITEKDFNTISELENLPYADEKFLDEALQNKLSKESSKKWINQILALVNCELNSSKNISQNNIVSYNRIENTGYAGIRLDGKNSIAEYNIIKNSLLHMNDGASLYCWAQNENYTFNNIIRNNIVLGAVGNCEATSNDLAFAYGIYIDNKCHHITIENNIVTGCTGGILVNDESHHQKIIGNTIYDNQFGLVFSEYFKPESLAGCEAYENILFSKRRNQRALFIESRIRETFKPGMLNTNLYANPYYPYPIAEQTFRDGVRIIKEFSLKSWQSHYGQDNDSTTIATSNHDMGGKKSLILINTSHHIKKFSIPQDVGYIPISGGESEREITIAPFRAIILIES